MKIYAEVEVEIKCPYCGLLNKIELSFDGEEGNEEIECDDCELPIQFDYNISVDIDNVEIGDIQPVDIDCPLEPCSGTAQLDITDEDGSDRIECESCQSVIYVVWSEYGKKIDEIELVKAGEVYENGDSEYKNRDDENDDENDDEDDDEDHDDEDYYDEDFDDEDPY